MKTAFKNFSEIVLLVLLTALLSGWVFISASAFSLLQNVVLVEV